MKISAGLDIRALRIFEAVASSGSLSLGARQLGVTQSAVSQTITQIEGILQTPVFDRSQRPFKLTPAGIALSRRARQIVEDMDRLVVQLFWRSGAADPLIHEFMEVTQEEARRLQIRFQA